MLGNDKKTPAAALSSLVPEAYPASLGIPQACAVMFMVILLRGCYFIV